MKIFKDRLAVVTVAASGIGRGMAEIFIEAGMIDNGNPQL